MENNFKKRYNVLKSEGGVSILKKFYENCQIFTPLEIVKYMLDTIGYKNNIIGKTVLENSCGDGNFLIEITQRFIRCCIRKKYSKKEIKKGLERDIYGYELDSRHFKKCLENLDSLACEYGIHDVEWKIYNKDYLKEMNNKKFDFIIGNPPYISYADLDLETRVYIKDKFSSCKEGKPDYYYAFIEQSLNFLNETGVLAYLIPNNIFKNRFGERIRNIMKDSLMEVIDYDNLKMFEGKLTTSSVIICSKAKKKRSIVYKNIPNELTYKIQKNNLNEKWIFNTDIEHMEREHVFGDEFNVFMSVATLLNKAFVISDFVEDNDYYIVERNYRIEKGAVRPAASPRGLSRNRTELIIFPYRYDNGLKKIGENFCNEFPLAYEYLERYRDELEKSNKDSGALWFEYGRSQALTKINTGKLLISPIVSNKVNVTILDQMHIPYSGIVITAKNNNLLTEAKRILESEDFLKYIESIGIKSNGNSIRISGTDIKKYKY